MSLCSLSIVVVVVVSISQFQYQTLYKARHAWVKDIQVVKMKGHAFCKGEDISKTGKCINDT